MYSIKQRVFPNSKAHLAGLRAITQVVHLVLASATIIRRKRHESVMSFVMGSSRIRGVLKS